MRCAYINLDAAKDRRRRLEANLAIVAPDWSVERFPALGPAEGGAIAGLQSPAAAACYLSHRQLIALSLNDDEDLLILEDDVALSPKAPAYIEAARQMLGEAWDVIHFNVGLGSLTDMFAAYRLTNTLLGEGGARIVNLAPHVWFGAVAYLVSGKSKGRIHDLLSEQERIDVPYDLYLRKLAREGRLRMGALLPFVVRLDETAQATQIHAPERAFTERAYSAFRAMLYIDRDMDECSRMSEELATEADAESRAFGNIVGAMNSRGFQP